MQRGEWEVCDDADFRGNDVATAVGAVGGAAVGANVNRGSQTTTQEVRKCTTVAGSAHPAYWDVTYVFGGVEHGRN